MVPFVRRHQLAVFVALAYGLSWAPWLWSPGGLLPVGPLLAALVVLSLTGGRTAVADWLRKIVHWRVGVGWYLLVLLVPPALTFAAVGIDLAVGATVVSGSAAPGAGALAAQFVVVLVSATNSVTFAWGWFAGPDQLRLWWIWAALWAAAAALAGSRLARSRTRRQVVS